VRERVCCEIQLEHIARCLQQRCGVHVAYRELHSVVQKTRGCERTILPDAVEQARLHLRADDDGAGIDLLESYTRQLVCG
jgi:hypothetical protein